MKRWTWGILLSVLAVGGCGRHAADDSVATKSPRPTAGQVDKNVNDPAPLERFEIGETPEEPTELDTQTLTEDASTKIDTSEEYNDNGPVFEHQGGGTPSGFDLVPLTGADASKQKATGAGSGSRARGSGGFNVQAWGEASGEGTGFGGRGSGHRMAMLGRYGGTVPISRPLRRPALRRHLETLHAGPQHLAADGRRKGGAAAAGDAGQRPHRRLPRPRVVGPLLLQRPIAATGGQFPVAAAGGGLALFLRLRPDRLPGGDVSPDAPIFFKPKQVRGTDTAAEQILALAVKAGSSRRPPASSPAKRRPWPIARRSASASIRRWPSGRGRGCSSAASSLGTQRLHRIVIGYDVDLVRAGKDLELRLDLPEKLPACVVDFSVDAPAENRLRIDAPGEPSGDAMRLCYRVTNPKQRPLCVRLHEPGTVMLSGGDGKGSYFATRLRPELPATEAGGGSRHAVFLVDVSLGARPQFAIWRKLLRSVLEGNRDRIEQFSVLFFNVEAFWWQERFVTNTPENVAALMKFCDGLAVEGAADLGRALLRRPPPAGKSRGGCPPATSSSSATARPPGAKTTGRCSRANSTRRRPGRCSPTKPACPAARADCWPSLPSKAARRCSPWSARRRSTALPPPTAPAPGGWPASKCPGEATCWWRAGRRSSSPSNNCCWSAAARSILRRRKSSSRSPAIRKPAKCGPRSTACCPPSLRPAPMGRWPWGRSRTGPRPAGRWPPPTPAISA